MGWYVYSDQTPSEHAKCTIFSRKLILGETSDGEFKLLRFKELDNDDLDGKPESTDEDTPPNFSNDL